MCVLCVQATYNETIVHSTMCRVADATGPVLEVSNTGLEDAGVYQCFITNSAGFDSSTALVEVQSESVHGVYHTCVCGRELDHRLKS